MRKSVTNSLVFFSQAGASPKVLTTEYGEGSKGNILCQTLAMAVTRRQDILCQMDSKNLSYTMLRYRPVSKQCC